MTKKTKPLSSDFLRHKATQHRKQVVQNFLVVLLVISFYVVGYLLA